MNNNPELDDDTIWLLLLGAVVLSTVSAAAFWDRVTQFLVDRQVLVSNPVWSVPGAADGAGLDMPRLAILLAGILGTLFLGISGARRRRSKR